MNDGSVESSRQWEWFRICGALNVIPDWSVIPAIRNLRAVDHLELFGFCWEDEGASENCLNWLSGPIRWEFMASFQVM
jgi:hypothetical protein